MNIALFYDTETTGLPLFKEPSEHPDQPHLVQLGALLVDTDTRAELAFLDLIVKPEGWTIPNEVAAIHGITTERALAEGVSERQAVELFLTMHSLAVGQAGRIAHNEQFDARILRIALKRHLGDLAADTWKGGAAYCTSNASSPILNLPPTDRMRAAGFTKPKTPKLAEAYEFFTGRKLEGAHSAIVDCRACKDVFFAIQDGVREQVARAA